MPVLFSRIAPRETIVGTGTACVPIARNAALSSTVTPSSQIAHMSAFKPALSSLAFIDRHVPSPPHPSPKVLLECRTTRNYKRNKKQTYRVRNTAPWSRRKTCKNPPTDARSSLNPTQGHWLQERPSTPTACVCVRVFFFFTNRTAKGPRQKLAPLKGDQKFSPLLFFLPSLTRSSLPSPFAPPPIPPNTSRRFALGAVKQCLPGRVKTRRCSVSA